jgi:hypothetical protein
MSGFPLIRKNALLVTIRNGFVVQALELEVILIAPRRLEMAETTEWSR